MCRVFDVLVNTLPLEVHGHQPPPVKPPAGWRDSMHARQFIASECTGPAWRPAWLWPLLGGLGCLEH